MHRPVCRGSPTLEPRPFRRHAIPFPSFLFLTSNPTRSAYSCSSVVRSRHSCVATPSTSEFSNVTHVSLSRSSHFRLLAPSSRTPFPCSVHFDHRLLLMCSTLGSGLSRPAAPLTTGSHQLRHAVCGNQPVFQYKPQVCSAFEIAVRIGRVRGRALQCRWCPPSVQDRFPRSRVRQEASQELHHANTRKSCTETHRTRRR